MTVEAYVFIECEQGKAREVAEKMLKIAGVVDTKSVTGPYDVIALVTAGNFKILGDVLIKKIQSLEGVKKTLTNVVID